MASPLGVDPGRKDVGDGAAGERSRDVAVSVRPLPISPICVGIGSPVQHVEIGCLFGIINKAVKLADSRQNSRVLVHVEVPPREDVYRTRGTPSI